MTYSELSYLGSSDPSCTNVSALPLSKFSFKLTEQLFLPVSAEGMDGQADNGMISVHYLSNPFVL